MRKIDELKAMFPDYAEWLYEDCSGDIRIDACNVYNSKEDRGNWDEECVPDGSESEEQQAIAALVNVCECVECCGCGGW